MTEAPQPKESFITNLKNRVTEIKNEAVEAWKDMDSRDVANTYLAGMGISTLGILFNVAGRSTELWAIEGLVTTYALMGAGAMTGSLVKMGELAVREAVAKRQNKNQGK